MKMDIIHAAIVLPIQYWRNMVAPLQIQDAGATWLRHYNRDMPAQLHAGRMVLLAGGVQQYQHAGQR